jgi:hypothetical protein
VKVSTSTISRPPTAENRPVFNNLDGLTSDGAAIARVRDQFGRPQRFAPDQIFNLPFLANGKGTTISSAPRAAAASEPNVVINSSPTIVIHAAAAGDLERQVLEALRNYRSELYDEWRREVARRERTEF